MKLASCAPLGWFSHPWVSLAMEVAVFFPDQVATHILQMSLLIGSCLNEEGTTRTSSGKARE